MKTLNTAQVKVKVSKLSLTCAKRAAKRAGVFGITSSKQPWCLRGIRTNFSDVTNPKEEVWGFTVELKLGQTWIYSKTKEEATLKEFIESDGRSMVRVSWGEGWSFSNEKLTDFVGFGSGHFYLKKGN